MKRPLRLRQIQAIVVALFLSACSAYAQSVPVQRLRVTDSRTAFVEGQLQLFSQPRRLVWSADSRQLAVTARHIKPLADGGWEEDFQVQVWDVGQSKRIQMLQTQSLMSQEAINLAWSPTGQTLAAFYNSGETPASTVLWNVKSGQIRRLWMMDYGKKEVLTSFLAGAPHGAWVGNGTECRLLRYTEGLTEKPEDWCVLDRFFSAQNKVTQRALTKRADSGVFAAAAIARSAQVIAVVPAASEASESRLYIFDAARGTSLQGPLESFPPRFQLHLAMSDDGTTLALLSGRTSIDIRLCSNGVKRQQLKTKHLLSKFALSPNGSRLAIHDQAGSVTLWDTASGRYIGYLGHVKVRHPTGLGLLAASGNADDVGALGRIAFSPDGNSLAVAGDDGMVTVFSLKKTMGAHGRDTVGMQ